MGFKTPDSGIAASVFLSVYVIYTFFTSYIVVTKGFKTTYTMLFVFGIIRVGAQLCGVAFAVLGFEHYQWLIAYLILGAEGYFTLILASFYFICKAQHSEVGHSWIMESGPRRLAALGGPFARIFRLWSGLYHLVLIPANSLVISGGSMLSGISGSDYLNNQGTIESSKRLRTAGNALFLTLTAITIITAICAFSKERIRRYTVVSVLVALPFLLVRGVFGVLSIYITDMNYFQLLNYENGTFSTKLVVYEYILSTTMEFVGASLLLLSYYLDDLRRERRSRYDSDDERELTVVDSEK